MDEKPPILESVKETARLLGGVTNWQVYRLLEAGELESRYIGKRRMVVRTSIEDYVANLPTERPVA